VPREYEHLRDFVALLIADIDVVGIELAVDAQVARNDACEGLCDSDVRYSSPVESRYVFLPSVTCR
jgi:hypothetical protein